MPKTEITFGKYKGQYVEDLQDYKYIRWLATNNEKPDAKFQVNEKIEQAAREILNQGKEPSGEKRGIPAPPQAKAPDTSKLMSDLEELMTDARDKAKEEEDPASEDFYIGLSQGISLAISVVTEWAATLPGTPRGV